ncbi:MAG: O-antigen translocase [Terriglobia bacterium]|jgi:PST family polysaccharide transporter
MKSIFRATAILSGSSIANILVGLVSAKVLAMVLQPSGYGYYGLVQSFVGLATLIAGMGVTTALVRLGAGPVTRGDYAMVASLRRAAWWLRWGLGGLALVVLWLFRGKVSQWALGTRDQAPIIVVLGIAVIFMVATNVQTGVLNAHHCVGSLAKYGVLNAVLGAIVTIGAVLLWRLQGVVPGVIAGTVVSCAVSGYYLYRDVGPVRVKTSHRESFKAAWSLLTFGGPFMASMLVGTGVALALPMVVLHLLNTESVGYYRAAAAISVNYLGFLVTAMGLDYYPRVSAVADRPNALVKLINEQHRLVMLLAVPMILGTLALVPYLVPLVYSSKFHPAVEILEWQLIGDLFKFAGWTMSFALLARGGSLYYFVPECISGVALLVSTWLAVRWFGLSGLGISFLLTSMIYYLAEWVFIRRKVPLRWTAWNKKMMLGGVAAAFVVRVIPLTRFAHFRTPVALTLAMAFGIPSLYVIWREFMASKDLEPGAH